MKYYVLFNPYAGDGTAEEKVKALSSLYQSEIIYRSVTDITDYASFFASLDGEDVVIVCGGDGTLNRFANNIAALDIPNDILYYAQGTGNDFLNDRNRETGCPPFSIKKYLEQLPTAEINGKTYRFFNNVGLGIDGYCTMVGDEQKKQAKKKVNYTSIAIGGLLFHYKPANATVVVDGKTYEYKNVWLAPTMKGRFVGGGMMLAPDQDREAPDQTLSCVVYHCKSRLKTLLTFPSVFKGTHVKHTKIVTVHTGKDIRVTFDRPAPLQTDGETILDVTSYHATANAKVFAEKSN